MFEHQIKWLIITMEYNIKALWLVFRVAMTITTYTFFVFINNLTYIFLSPNSVYKDFVVLGYLGYFGLGRKTKKPYLINTGGTQ